MFKVMGSAPAKAVFLLCAAAMVWFVPYLVPVAPSIALSYVVGYNNRVAVALFFVAAFAFAYVTRGMLARVGEEQDQRMRVADLMVGLVVILTALLVRHHHAQPPKAEAAYAIDRLQMLAAGVRPYTGFEYVYGPLQLYVPLLLSRLLRITLVNGYYVWWYAQWLTGTCMAWGVAKLLPGRFKHRRFLFPFILLTEVLNIGAEGTAYTPVRMIGAAFVVLAVCACWQRRRNPALLLSVAAGATLFEFGISPEQGLAVGLGLLGWLVLKAWHERTVSAAGVAAGMAFSLSVMCLWLNWLGVFGAVREFGGGAFCFPLVPSLPGTLLLLAYVAAACAGMRAWLARDLDGSAIAMALCGFAVLPAAFGRCDTGHMELGSAALFLGYASIETMPGLRRVWTPLLLLIFVFLPVLSVGQFAVAKMQHRIPPPGPDPHNLSVTTGGGGVTLVLSAPCPVIYRAPTIWPLYSQTAAQNCLDTGYFAGMLDVLTPATIARKVEEVTAEPRRPLLLQAGPLEEQFRSAVTETDPESIRGLEQALYVPPVRHQALDYGPVIRAIRDNYTPGPLVVGGMQVWEPKVATGK